MTPAKRASAASDRAPVAAALRSLLEPYAASLNEVENNRLSYCLETGYIEAFKKPLFVAGVREGKAYVSYYLMPVYAYPDLLEGMSPQLKKHMQGKSCFNFKQVDPELFAELKTLTKRSFARFRKEGYV
jgi:hypothetical protein